MATILPRPDAHSPRWHISPAVDLLGYHLAWVAILVPLLFYGIDRYTDYLHLYVLVMVASFTHRHFTFPYVYLDRQVFAKHPYRFIVAPALALWAFLATPALYAWKVPVQTWSGVHVLVVMAAIAVLVQLIVQVKREVAPGWAWLGAAVVPLAIAGTVDLFAAPGPAWTGLAWLVALTATSGLLAAGARPRRWPLGVTAVLAVGCLLGLLPAMQVGQWPAEPFRFKQAIQGAFFVGAVWNVWHVYMQKFGIMRMYAAKSGVPAERRTPHAVDRLLVFSWLPLVVLVLAVTAGDTLNKVGTGSPLAVFIADNVAPWAAYALPVGVGIVALAVGLFLYYEYRADRWSNPARLVAALSLMGVNCMFLFVDPIKVYIAFGFAHAIEYMVFVWAFQRKRYQAPLAHKPLLGWLSRRPWLLYGVLLLGVGGTYFLFAYGHRYFDWGRPKLAGTTLVQWAFFWTIWQQVLHFWFDGFLWKMRLPAVRGNL